MAQRPVREHRTGATEHRQESLTFVKDKFDRRVGRQHNYISVQKIASQARLI